MFKWLKKLIGLVPPAEPLILTDPIKHKDEVKVTERPAKPAPSKPKAQKSATKPKKKAQKSVDLNAMSKKDLLAHAKANGIKANASLKKDELIERINAG